MPKPAGRLLPGNRASRLRPSVSRACLGHRQLAPQAKPVRPCRPEHCDPFDPGYQRYIIAALISFDLGRVMDDNADRHIRGEGTFATALEAKPAELRPRLSRLCNLRLDQPWIEYARRTHYKALPQVLDYHNQQASADLVPK
jgi:hypothetical protein